VQRFVRKRRGTQTPEARVVIVTAPGQEAQVDYGTGLMVRDPESRKYRRTRLFVMTLGCSRKSVRLLTFRSSSRLWAELHERAFRRLGGATRIVVLDNLREGVLEEACAAALDMGVQEYRFVRRYLERCPQAPLSLQQAVPRPY
jgi:transposase